jgi:hypothetical protein
MVIKPVNKIYIPSTLISASTSSEKPLATGMWGQDETDIQPAVRQRDVGGVTWFGINGPEVWVGPMRESLFFSSSSTTSDGVREMS